MYYQPVNEAERTSPGMNTGAMISGIMGLLSCAIPFIGCVVPSVAIILSLLGRGNQMKLKGSGLGGLVMGIIGIVGNVVFTIVLFSALVIYFMSESGLV